MFLSNENKIEVVVLSPLCLMQTSEKNSGWEDLIFIPPGKSHSQHIQEVAKV